MKLKTNIMTVLLSGVLSFSIFGCTREEESGSLRIRLPQNVSQQSLSPLVNEPLVTAFFNVRIPGQPVKSYHFDFHSNSSTQTEFVVPNVPVGSGALVQYLGVHLDQVNGFMKFRYGDVVHDIVPGDNFITITAAPAGSSNREHRIAGRLETAAGVGPSGTMIMYLHPPNNKPKMAIEEYGIYNGWFDIFHPGDATGTTIKFSYELKNGNVVFPPFTVSEWPVVPSVDGYSVEIQKPVSYDKREGGMISGATSYHFGWYRPPGALNDIATGKDICYLSVSENIPGLYADSALTQIFGNSASSVGTPQKIVKSSGPWTAYTYITMPTCDTSSNNFMRFYHRRLQEREGEYIGMRGPFRLLDDSKSYDGYLRSYFDEPNQEIELYWAYLPGAQSALTGLKLFTKYSSNGGGGHEEYVCLNPQNYGYQHLADLPNSATGYSHFVGNITQGWSYVLCPILVDGSVGQEIRNHGLHDFHDVHFGRRVPGDTLTDVTIATNTQYTTTTNAGTGYSTRLIGLSLDVANKYTLLEIPDGFMGGFDEGDEVLVSRLAGTNAGCGNYNGQPVSMNFHSFARIIAKDAADGTKDILKVLIGHRVDELQNATGLATATTSGNNFCHVSVAKVLEFGDLTINPYTNFSLSQNIDTTSGTTGGGVFPIRVAGTLAMGQDSVIDANGSGFLGGDNTLSPTHGAGLEGNSDGASWSFDAGQGYSSTNNPGGGGAGFGDGADSQFATTSGGFGWGTPGDYYETMFFSGAGGGAAEDSGILNGGNGGGSIYLAANRMLSNAAPGGTPKIQAKGDDNATFSGYSSGAGGGGSVNVLVGVIDAGANTRPFNFDASGGMALSAGTESGGDGGGGYIHVQKCEPDGDGDGNPDYTTTVGAVGSASAGYVNSDYGYFCNN